jgi:hypothetical protein
MVITAARVVGDVQEHGRITNKVGACCALGSENCGATARFDVAETTRFMWEETERDYGLTIGS